MIFMEALNITYFDIHTVDYYMQVVDKLVEYGTDEIGLKDMTGIEVVLLCSVNLLKRLRINIRIFWFNITGTRPRLFCCIYA